MSKFLRVNFRKQAWGYARVGGMEMSASLSVHEMGTFGVGIGDVVAVSHVWGDARYEVENVQGASHGIMLSSPEKMRHLLSIAERYGWENLWLDNICINQEDDEEKSREVMKMGDVYRKTKATLILLGSTRSKLLTETMSTILEFKGLPKVDIPSEMVPQVDWEACMLKCLELGQDEWYGRLWTVQESALASSIYMAPVDKDVVEDASGFKECDHFWCRLLLCTAESGWDINEVSDPRARVIWNLCRWRLTSKRGEFLSVREALEHTSLVKCSIERDRVYGILGLLKNVNITPTYDDTSLEEVAVTVAKACVNNLKQMDLLHFAGPMLQEMGKHMVPAWDAYKLPKICFRGIAVHWGNCMYDENVGLKVSDGPRVVSRAKVLLEIRAKSLVEKGPELSLQHLLRALKMALHDDQILELIRGMMLALECPQYWDEVKAREYFNMFAHAASLPCNTNIFYFFKEKFSGDQIEFHEFVGIWNILLSDRISGGSTYILGITKDNNCTCSCCQRTYITIMRSWTPLVKSCNLLVADYRGLLLNAREGREDESCNLLVVDYRGLLINTREGREDDRVSLIVAEPVQEGVMKFISAIVVDREILHEPLDLRREINFV